MFRLFSSLKKRDAVQVGMSENEQIRCFVWHDNHQRYSHWEQNTAPFDPTQAVSLPEKFTLIQAVPNHYIWQKTLLLPFEPSLNKRTQKQNELLRYKQIIQILKNELPIALDEVYFDTIIETQAEKNTQLIELYALRKHYAHSRLNTRSTALDSELHCYARGLSAYLQDPSPYYYALNDLIFHFVDQRIEILKHPIDSPLFNSEQIDFPKNTLDKTLYLIALGASLWQ